MGPRPSLENRDRHLRLDRPSQLLGHHAQRVSARQWKWPDGLAAARVMVDEGKMMSAIGTKRTSMTPVSVSALRGKADIPNSLANVR